MNVRVKICGMSRYEDAKTAVGLGVDAVGFIFYGKSPRFIRPADVGAIARKLPPFVSKVGVFVDEDAMTINATIRAAGIDTIQLHGNEDPGFCEQFSCSVIKAFGVGPRFDLSILGQYKVCGYLLDTWDDTRKGGTGKSFDWSIARRAALSHDNIVLAGGLGVTNLAEALETVNPYGIDLNSGVEVKPGEKNPHKMRDALKIVRRFEQGPG